MSYTQITPEERYTLAMLRKQVPRLSDAAIGRILGRHRSTIGREIARNSSRHDGAYRYSKAQEKAGGRRSRSRRRCQFTAEDWALVEARLREFHSPKQISGRLRKDGILDISHESIYLHVWRDKQRSGELYRSLRQARKKARKRYGSHEKRGRVDGKRHLSERPAVIEDRTELGHWEIDTVMGSVRDTHCIVTLVERATGKVLPGATRSPKSSTTGRASATTSSPRSSASRSCSRPSRCRSPPSRLRKDDTPSSILPLKGEEEKQRHRRRATTRGERYRKQERKIS